VKDVKRDRLLVMVDLLGTAINILHSAWFDNPRECEHLVHIWVNEGLFSALEENIESIVAITPVTSMSSFLPKNTNCVY
jgi:hypothetical protein